MFPNTHQIPSAKEPSPGLVRPSHQMHSHLSTFMDGVSLAFPPDQLSSLLCSIITATPSTGLFTASSGFLTHLFFPSPHLLPLCTTHTPPLRVFRDLQVWVLVPTRSHQWWGETQEGGTHGTLSKVPGSSQIRGSGWKSGWGPRLGAEVLSRVLSGKLPEDEKS